MPRKRLRALVLSAGYGTRLRPLTDTLPKPLLPVAGVPILGHALAALQRAGCEAAAINLHYLGGQIRQRFGAAYRGMPLVYSEEPEILGTLGALHPLREFFAPADLVLLLNGDSLCRWPLSSLVRRHQEQGARATLLFTARPDPAGFGGGVGLDAGDRVVSFRRGADGAADEGVARRLVFAGAHVFSTALLERLRPGFGDIVRDLYQPLLAESPGSLAGLVTGRLWHDLGTPRRYLEGALDWLAVSHRRGGGVAAGAAVGPKAKVVHSMVEAGAVIGAGARVERSLVLPGARVGEHSTVLDSIVGFDAAVPAGAWIAERLATPAAEPEAEGLFAPLG